MEDERRRERAAVSAPPLHTTSGRGGAVHPLRNRATQGHASHCQKPAASGLAAHASHTLRLVPCEDAPHIAGRVGSRAAARRALGVRLRHGQARRRLRSWPAITQARIERHSRPCPHRLQCACFETVLALRHELAPRHEHGRQPHSCSLWRHLLACCRRRCLVAWPMVCTHRLGSHAHGRGIRRRRRLIRCSCSMRRIPTWLRLRRARHRRLGRQRARRRHTCRN